MRAWWCGFALLLMVVCAALAVTVLVRRSGAIGLGTFALDSRSRALILWSAVWLVAICAGFGYAAWRADVRLATALPSE